MIKGERVMRKRDPDRIGERWNEGRSIFWPALKVLGVLAVFLFAFGMFTGFLGFFGEAGNVIREEFGPRDALDEVSE